MQKLFYRLTTNELTVYLADGTIAKWSINDPAFDTALDMCKQNNYVRIQEMANPIKTLFNPSSKVRVIKDTLSINDVDYDTGNNKLFGIIKTLVNRKFVETQNVSNIKPLIKRIVANPYINAAEELFDFFLTNDFEITEDGCILAYKGVDNDYTSRNNFLNPINQWVYEPNFDTNRNNTCSTGLHFCGKEYLIKHFSKPKYLLIKVQPEDVVSIPTDCGHAKGRAVKYFIVAEMPKETFIKNIDTEALAKANNVSEPVKTIPKNTERTTETFADRNAETYHWYTLHKDIDTVAKIMEISPETVKRNLRRYKNNK